MKRSNLTSNASGRCGEARRLWIMEVGVALMPGGRLMPGMRGRVRSPLEAVPVLRHGAYLGHDINRGTAVLDLLSPPSRRRRLDAALFVCSFVLRPGLGLAFLCSLRDAC